MKKTVIKIFVILFIFSILSFLLGYLLNIDLDNSINLLPSFKEIIINNLTVNFSAIIFSVCTFGVYSLIYLFNEFFFLGAVIKSLSLKKGLFYALSFIGIHGIIEIPAIVLSATIGIFIVINIFKRVIKKSIFNYRIILYLILLNIFLIIFAGIIETIITPWFLKTFII